MANINLGCSLNQSDLMESDLCDELDTNGAMTEQRAAVLVSRRWRGPCGKGAQLCRLLILPTDAAAPGGGKLLAPTQSAIADDPRRQGYNDPGEACLLHEAKSRFAQSARRNHDHPQFGAQLEESRRGDRSVA